MSFLLELPAVVLNRVFKELDFYEIQTLRKVCRVLCEYIDESKPDSNVFSVKIVMAPQSNVILYTRLTENQEKKREAVIVGYQNSETDCIVLHRNKQKLLKNEDFLKIAITDFNLTLKNQKSVIYEFGITTESGPTYPIMKQLSDLLKSWPRPFQAQVLSMKSLHKGDIFMILPHLDPKYLKHLYLYYINENDFQLELNDIMKLEQWKNLKQVSTTGIINMERFFEHLMRLDYVSVKVDVLTERDADRIKEIFFQSANNISVFLLSKSFTGDLSFGAPAQADKIQSYYFDEFNWFFRIPKSDKILAIAHSDQHIHFMRIDREQLPNHAVVRY